MEEKQILVFDTNAMEWEQRINEGNKKVNYRKKLNDDPTTGGGYQLRKYPKGFHVPRHFHSASHGVYVLEGHFWSDGKVYGPGTVLWYPQGVIAEHGATDDEDVVVFFFTDGKFDTYYV